MRAPLFRTAVTFNLPPSTFIQKAQRDRRRAPIPLCVQQRAYFFFAAFFLVAFFAVFF